MLLINVAAVLSLASGAFSSSIPRPSPPYRSIIGRGTTPSSEGVHDGYYYNWWNDGQSPNVTYKNALKGSYVVDWKTSGNFVGGKGWKQGARRNVTYSADFKTVGNGYLAVYGWGHINTKIHVEYYILEARGTYNPGQNNTPKGSITVDGAVYQLSSYTRVSPGLNDPIIHQHFAVREQQRTSGTVDTGIFFDAWEAAGLKMGDLGYQIVATEGYHSEGASRVTVETPP